MKLAIVFFILFIKLSSLSAAIVTGVWTFNNLLPTDNSGYKNDGVIYGDARIVDYELILGGNGGMNVNNSESLCPKEGVYLQLDITFNEIRSNWIIDKMSPDYKNGYLLRTLDGTNELQFYVGNGITSEYLTTTIQPNKRYKVYAIYNGNYMALYLNGRLQDWKSFNGKISYLSTQDLYIGSQKGNSCFLNAIVDNIEIGYSEMLPLSISSKYLPGGIINNPYKFKLEAFGGQPPYKWFAVGLPSGLTLDSLTGFIEGTIKSSTLNTKITVWDNESNPDTSTAYFSSTFLNDVSKGIEFVSGNGTYLHATTVYRTSPQIIYSPYLDDNLFAVYQNLNLDPEIISYSYKEKKWTPPEIVGSNPLNSDQHGHPALCMDNEGYLHVFFGAHSSPLKHVVSGNPADISSWIQYQDVTNSATYPNVLAFPKKEIIVFYRPIKDYRYIKSDNNGKSWGKENIIIDWGPNFCIYPDAGIKFDSNIETIHLCWSVWFIEQGKHRGLFYTKSNDFGNTWMNSTDSVLSLPISQKNSETVYYNDNETTYGININTQFNGRPIILFNSKLENEEFPKVKLAIKKSNSWEIRDISTTWNGYSGGIVFQDTISKNTLIFFENTQRFLEMLVLDSLFQIVNKQVIQPLPNHETKAMFPKAVIDAKGTLKVLFQGAINDTFSYLFIYNYLLASDQKLSSNNPFKNNDSPLVEVYFNQTSKELCLELEYYDGDLNIQLTTIKGSIVFNKKSQMNSNSTLKINVSNLNQGLYILTVRCGSNIINKKIVLL